MSIALLLYLFTPLFLLAQTGTITGKVTDQSSGEELIEKRRDRLIYQERSLSFYVCLQKTQASFSLDKTSLIIFGKAG